MRCVSTGLVYCQPALWLPRAAEGLPDIRLIWRESLETQGFAQRGALEMLLIPFTVCVQPARRVAATPQGGHL